MTPHKWSKEIKAWADGAEIESKYVGLAWEVDKCPFWNRSGGKFRIKPQPKEPQYLYVYEAGGQYQLSFLKSEGLMFPYGGTMEIFKYKGKIKLEVDDE
jgi:hypothetical protein